MKDKENREIEEYKKLPWFKRLIIPSPGTTFRDRPLNARFFVGGLLCIILIFILFREGAVKDFRGILIISFIFIMGIIYFLLSYNFSKSKKPYVYFPITFFISVAFFLVKDFVWAVSVFFFLSLLIYIEAKLRNKPD